MGVEKQSNKMILSAFLGAWYLIYEVIMIQTYHVIIKLFTNKIALIKKVKRTNSFLFVGGVVISIQTIL